MLHKLVIGALGAMAVMFSSAAIAQGTATEANAMLDKAVVALKADKAKTLDMINKEEGGFLDRDLYVFCFNLSDGKQVAAAVIIRGSTLARTSGPLKTQLAKRSASTCTLPRRKVKSLRSATRFQSQAPTRRRLQK